MDQAERKTDKTKPFILDRVIWTVLTPIIKTFGYLYDLLFPEFERTERVIRANELCYCDSRKKYSECHQPILKRKGKIAVRTTKTYNKSQRIKIKYKVKVSHKLVSSEFKPGSINPLNSDGKFVDTDGYSG